MILNKLGHDWHWPDDDHACAKITFGWIEDVAKIAQHAQHSRVCVQAGGNMGVWPWAFSRYFKTVHTFEPDRTCYELMLRNIAGWQGIVMHAAALGARETTCRVQQDEPGNWGAQYAVFGEGEIPVTTIDKLGLEACDLIQLDVEGGELDALKGAAETIAAHQPAVAVEVRKHATRYGGYPGDAVDWLVQTFGYRKVAKYHKDIVLVPA